MKTIGILAGMGPRSTSPFLELVLDQCQKQYGARYDIDYPHIIIYSLPTPFYLDRPIDHTELKASIIEGLKRLESCGVTYIAMPCNTAHKYYEELTAAIDKPLLNIIDETLENIFEGRRITLFATESTFDSGLYQKELKKKGYEFFFEDLWQDKVNEIITMIKSGQNDVERNKKWNDLLKLVYEQDIDSIIIACTDLNVVLQDSINKYSMTFIDSSECLAKAVISEYLK